MELTHFDNLGNARMVDVGGKENTGRTATAKGSVKVSGAVIEAVSGGTAVKGDVLTVATTAGIMGAKKTFELIPMCHILLLSKCEITWEIKPEEGKICCTCICSCSGKTGVEMEALTGASIALLTVYDMCKAIDKSMEIGEIYLAEKDGGKSGHFVNER